MSEKKVDLCIYRMRSAVETLGVSALCLESQHYKDSINRSYYAAFYAVKAVLALEEVDFKRHKDAVAYFNKTYVATDIFPREIGKKLGRLKQERETSDYDDFYISLQPLDIFVIYNDVCYLFPHHPFLMTHFLIHNIFPA